MKPILLTLTCTVLLFIIYTVASFADQPASCVPIPQGSSLIIGGGTETQHINVNGRNCTTFGQATCSNFILSCPTGSTRFLTGNYETPDVATNGANKRKNYPYLCIKNAS